MSFWAVVFIVFMILWLVFGCYLGWRGTGPPDFGPVVGHTLIPWACVAILGYIVLTGGASAPLR